MPPYYSCCHNVTAIATPPPPLRLANTAPCRRHRQQAVVPVAPVEPRRCRHLSAAAAATPAVRPRCRCNAAGTAALLPPAAAAMTASTSAATTTITARHRRRHAAAMAIALLPVTAASHCCCPLPSSPLRFFLLPYFTFYFMTLYMTSSCAGHTTTCLISSGVRTQAARKVISGQHSSLFSPSPFSYANIIFLFRLSSTQAFTSY